MHNDPAPHENSLRQLYGSKFLRRFGGRRRPSVRQKPPSPPPPIFAWTGSYIGSNAGYLLKNNDSIDVATANLFDQTRTGIGPASALGASGSSGARLDGVMYGVQLGYNEQFADKFVAGFETYIQGGHAQGGGNFGSVTSVQPALIPGLTSAVTQVNVSRGSIGLAPRRGASAIGRSPTRSATAPCPWIIPTEADLVKKASTRSFMAR